MNFSAKTKITIAITTIVGLVVGLALLLHFRTDWEPAFAGLDGETAVAVENVLREEGIRSRVDVGSMTIYVDSADVDGAWMVVQSAPALQEERFTFAQAIAESGYSWSIGMDTPELELRHNQLVRAREDEIAQVLMQMSEIDLANVLITQPFHAEVIPLGEIESALATIVIYGDDLTYELGELAALIASRAVSGLDIENIAVVDGGEMRVLFRDGICRALHCDECC